MRLAPRLATLVAVLSFAGGALAVTVEPVRQITVVATPFYESGSTLAEPLKITVDPAFDQLLMSRKPADIRKVRDAIAASPDLVKPTTMMALAARLYDVGLRDDAVFWLYVARDRWATVEAVLDTRSLALVGTARAMELFVASAGAAINSYAYCDLPRQQAQNSEAISWVAKHPYRLLEATDMPSEVADRNQALGHELASLQDQADAEQAFLAKPANLAEMKAVREQNHADERFCWK